MKKHLKYLSLLFIVAGVIYNQIILLGLGFFLVAIIVLCDIWLSKVEKNLKIDIVRSVNVSHINKPVNITYSIENKSILPLTYVILTVSLHKNISANNLTFFKQEGYYNFYKLHFSLPPKRKVSKKITIVSNSRGNYQLGDINLTISDPLLISTKKIICNINKNIVIYPKIKKTYILEKQLFKPDGMEKSNIIWIENRILHKGAREYLPTDSLSKIDWKQTSRQGKLYSKEYEYTSKQKIWILANLKTIENKYIFEDNEKKIEEIISTVASLAYCFSSHNISYKIAMNIKIAKTNSIYQLNSDNPNKDLKKILLQLAKLKSYKNINFLHTLKTVKANVDTSITVIVLVSTFLSDEIKIEIEKLKREKYTVIWINPSYQKQEGIENE